MKNETIYDVVEHAREVVYDEIRMALERTPGHKTDIDVRLVEKDDERPYYWATITSVFLQNGNVMVRLWDDEDEDELDLINLTLDEMVEVSDAI